MTHQITFTLDEPTLSTTDIEEIIEQALRGAKRRKTQERITVGGHGIEMPFNITGEYEIKEV